ncbi:hypothetical protein PPERSA_03706 [Pseudocohnilembus persalinus]|uniref:Uncharacterized protein n=1 Tax=Pseudocohnilembus persalinus TaxID=266149 RepID=A0A0V0QG93_PSEPJ|nr:hypothetical protein PPERSA_03706 [Pseudocohnilembus persalinus]|eukprot:KRX01202.1 hypothetical protein PPERSA_03706 [Pseudocohnilembus persalinus]
MINQFNDQPESKTAKEINYETIIKDLIKKTNTLVSELEHSNYISSILLEKNLNLKKQHYQLQEQLNKYIEKETSDCNIIGTNFKNSLMFNSQNHNSSIISQQQQAQIEETIREFQKQIKVLKQQNNEYKGQIDSAHKSLYQSQSQAKDLNNHYVQQLEEQNNQLRKRIMFLEEQHDNHFMQNYQQFMASQDKSSQMQKQSNQASNQDLFNNPKNLKQSQAFNQINIQNSQSKQQQQQQEQQQQQQEQQSQIQAHKKVQQAQQPPKPQSNQQSYSQLNELENQKQNDLTQLSIPNEDQSYHKKNKQQQQQQVPQNRRNLNQDENQQNQQYQQYQQNSQLQQQQSQSKEPKSISVDLFPSQQNQQKPDKIQQNLKKLNTQKEDSGLVSDPSFQTGQTPLAKANQPYQSSNQDQNIQNIDLRNTLRNSGNLENNRNSQNNDYYQDFQNQNQYDQEQVEHYQQEQNQQYQQQQQQQQLNNNNQFSQTQQNNQNNYKNQNQNYQQNNYTPDASYLHNHNLGSDEETGPFYQANNLQKLIPQSNSQSQVYEEQSGDQKNSQVSLSRKYSNLIQPNKGPQIKQTKASMLRQKQPAQKKLSLKQHYSNKKQNQY